MTHVIRFLVLENLLDKSIEIFITEANKAFDVFMLTYHRFYSFTEPLIIKQKRKYTEAEYF